MIDSTFIKNIISFEFDKYKNVSSREKLVVFAIQYLNLNNIETNWTNVCITAYKLFPEKFYLSDEFKEYPAIERLNRTLLHLRPKEQNYAIGSPSVNYVLTPLGKEVAFQVAMILEQGVVKSKSKENVLEKNQHTLANDYKNFISHTLYIEVIENKMDVLDFVWLYFEVTPFTQRERIKKKLLSIREYAMTKQDNGCIQSIDRIIKSI